MEGAQAILDSSQVFIMMIMVWMMMMMGIASAVTQDSFTRYLSKWQSYMLPTGMVK